MPATPHPSDKTIPQATGGSARGFRLSMEEVERLLTEETPDIRIDILRKVAHGHAERRYSLQELAAAEQILRLLVRDTEISVRESLAVALKDNALVPRDIMLSLSRDVDSVALPVIESSSILTDSDLIALIQSAKHAAKPSAAARRKFLSAEVSAALVGTHNVQIVSELIKNSNVELPEALLQSIVQVHAANAPLMGVMAQRPGLPVTVVEKIIALVSETLAENLRIQYRLTPSSIAAETEKTREDATLKLLESKHIHAYDVEKLVDQLMVFGRLTPSIILTSLCRGSLYFFEASLARLSSIPIRNAQLLIHDKGGLGFKALYAKAALPDKFFSACKLLLEVVADLQRAGEGGAGKLYADTLAAKLLARAGGRNVENLSYIIALVRQNG